MASTRSDLIKSGYREILAVSIEGIPYIFTEDAPPRHDSDSTLATPANYTRVSPCLFFKSGDKLEVEIDRETGFSRGAAVDVLLSWQEGEVDEVFASLFSLDRNETEISSDLAHDATTVSAVTTGFTDPGGSYTSHLYIGRELITYTDATGSSFTGCTRGVLSENYKYVTASPSYRKIADKPVIWRGRQITVHAHLVSPMGVALDDTWLTGTYHRILWRGYIDTPPRATADGMVLRSLPLCRLPSQEIGHQIKAALYKYDTDPQAAAGLPVYNNPAQVVTMRITTSSTIYTIDLQESTPTVQTLGSWAHFTAVRIATALAGVTGFIEAEHSLEVINGRTHVCLEVVMNGSTFVTGAEYWINVSDDGPYFLEPGQIASQPSGYGVGTLKFKIPVRYQPTPGAWLAVLQTEGEAWNDLTIPSRGIGLVEGEAGVEVISWDSKITAADALYQGGAEGVTMRRSSARAINGSADLDLAAGGDLSIMSGASGTVSSVIQTVMISSGTGTRGSKDTLSMAMGYGINNSLLDAETFKDPKLNTDVIEGVSDGRASLETLVGGWMVLNRRAFTQAMDGSGDCLLGIVQTTVPSVLTINTIHIDPEDVLLTGVEAPEVLDGSNEVKIDLSGIQEGDTVITQDLPRIQAEGPRSRDLSAPGMDTEKASWLSATLISQSDGLAVVSLQIAPWIDDIQPGTPVNLRIAHPAIYDFQTGTRGGDSVQGRVLGWSYDIETGQQQITILLAGNVKPPRLLCPSAFVTGSAGSTATTLAIGATAVAFFRAGEKVHVYNPGSGDLVELTIDAVNASSLDFTAQVGFSTSVALRSVVTYCDEADASSTQDDYAYVNSTTTWE